MVKFNKNNFLVLGLIGFLYWATANITFAQYNSIPVHDPVMIKQDNMYYLFCTGKGVAMWSSKDMKNWKFEQEVFDKSPEWTEKVVPGFDGHMWAPDISYHNGEYYLYYSVSAFMKNTSAIGVATNKTLHPNDPNYKWVDHGIVIQSVPGRDQWNAIDPNLAFDKQGQPWLAFGSFWEGLKIVKLNQDLKSIAENPQEWHTIARRPRTFELDERDPGDGAVEAPFIFEKGDYYYLFASFDLCCRGENSTYKMVVGRSKELTGPYLDKEGKSMTQGGGSLVMEGNENWFGVGHNSTYTFEGQDYLIFHGYDANDGGKAKLRIEKLSWDENGWPVVVNPKAKKKK